MQAKQLIFGFVGLIGLALVVGGFQLLSADVGGGDFRAPFGLIIALLGIIVSFIGLVGWLKAGNRQQISEEERQSKNLWQGFLELSLMRKLVVLVGLLISTIGALVVVLGAIGGSGIVVGSIICGVGVTLLWSAWPKVLEDFTNTSLKARALFSFGVIGIVSFLGLITFQLAFDHLEQLQEQRQEREAYKTQAFLDAHPEGPFVEFYSNGEKESEGTYNADGKLEGVYTYWYQGGQKVFERHYLDGIRHGPSNGWYQDGQKSQEENYDDGELDGHWLTWYENGQLRYEGNYINGQYDGLQLHWHENGQKQSEKTYVGGMPQGTETQWYDNGQKSYQTYADGPWTSWNRDGTEKPKSRGFHDLPSGTISERGASQKTN